MIHFKNIVTLEDFSSPEQSTQLPNSNTGGLQKTNDTCGLISNDLCVLYG